MKTPPRDFRDVVRSEADRLDRVAALESKKPPHLQKKHIIDGAGVAAQSLRSLASKWASEARQEEVLQALDASLELAPFPSGVEGDGGTLDDVVLEEFDDVVPARLDNGLG